MMNKKPCTYQVWTDRDSQQGELELYMYRSGWEHGLSWFYCRCRTVVERRLLLDHTASRHCRYRQLRYMVHTSVQTTTMSACHRNTLPHMSDRSQH